MVSELLWRSNMRSCRFEDGSAYFPTGGKSYFRQPNKKYFYVAVALLFLWTKLLPFHERVVRRKISISSCCTNCWEKIIANMQKDRGRQGQGWRKTNVLWEIGYYTTHAACLPLLLGLRVRERCPQTTIGIYQALLTVCTGWPDQRVESYKMWILIQEYTGIYKMQ